MNEPQNKASLSAKDVAIMATQIGFSVSLSTVFFILGGRFLDKYLETSPLFMIIGAILGLFFSLYLVWQIVKPLQQIK
jgi:F0F1-type ATP synthase assembly protein I